MYTLNNPLKYVDPNGLSTLSFDGSTKTLTLTSKEGKKLGSWKASNNVSSKSKHGKWINGTYAFSHQNLAKYSSNKKGDAIDLHGILVFKVPTEDKKSPSKAEGGAGLGVHAGRQGKTDKAGRKNENYATNGCIRTTDEAMKKIDETHKEDPVTSLKVENNKPPEVKKEGNN